MNVQFGQAGSYAMVVTNIAATATSSNAVLTVNPPPPCATPPSGLISWWRGESNALDEIGGNNGMLINGTMFTAGKVGQAFSFDGVDDYVQATTTGFPAGNSNRTIEFWVRINEFLSGDEVFFVGYGNFCEIGRASCRGKG